MNPIRVLEEIAAARHCEDDKALLREIYRIAGAALSADAAARAVATTPAASGNAAGRAENGPLPVSEADRETITALRVERDALREALTPFVKSIIVHWDDVLRAPPRTPVTINGITKAHVDEARSLLSPPDEKRG